MSTPAPLTESPACYVAFMHSTWDKAAFRRHLRRIMSDAGLSQQDVAELAGISRPQVSRWTRAEHRPDFDAISRLAAAVSHDRPDLADTTNALLAAAGYGPRQPAARTAPPPRQDRPRFPDDPVLDDRAALIWDDKTLRAHFSDGELKGMIEVARRKREQDLAAEREEDNPANRAVG